MFVKLFVMASIIGLHMEYRLWIAEMNADINVLRIFDDYVLEMNAKHTGTNATSHIEDFKEQFITLRKEVDELRHEMHLNKMKIAAFAKTKDIPARKLGKTIHHKELKARYFTFKKEFDKIKKDFQKFGKKQTGILS